MPRRLDTRVDLNLEQQSGLARHPGEILVGVAAIRIIAVIAAVVAFISRIDGRWQQWIGPVIVLGGPVAVFALLQLAVRCEENPAWRRTFLAFAVVEGIRLAETLAKVLFSRTATLSAAALVSGIQAIGFAVSGILLLIAAADDLRWQRQRSVLHWVGVAAGLLLVMVGFLVSLAACVRQYL
ncbi:MAG: hypothetical protein CMJ58_20785 [Planctomycetaceae bacterium]|nr:hypothetical protein [Planctomycetaceae bacterium]